MSTLNRLPAPLKTGLLAVRDQLRQRTQLRELAQLRSRAVKRIIVGAGPTAYPGWVGTDMAALNLLQPDRWEQVVAPDSLDAVLAEHVWEHLAPADALTAARTCFRFLKPGGYLRVAVPDGCHPDPAYIDQVRPGGSGPGSDDHQVLYTHETFCAVFQRAGFETRLLEYFDSVGAFQHQDWDPEGGMVTRSRRFDPRNKTGLNYTSIVLDAIKPIQ